MVDEKWDLFGLGKIVKEILERTEAGDDLPEWKEWVARAISETPFESVAHSMEALHGVGDIAQYGVKTEDSSEISSEETERLRKRREQEWAFEEKTGNIRFRRNMTGLVGGFSCLYI